MPCLTRMSSSTEIRSKASLNKLAREFIVYWSKTPIDSVYHLIQNNIRRTIIPMNDMNSQTVAYLGSFILLPLSL